MAADLPLARMAVPSTMLVLLYAAIPSLTLLQPWMGSLLVALVGWRVIAWHRGWQPPRHWSRILLTLPIVAGLYLSFGGLSGRTAAMGALVVLTAVKLLESFRRRDLMILLMLSFFLLASLLLRKPEVWAVIYAAFGCWLTLSVQVLINQGAGPAQWWRLPRRAGRIALHAIPAALLLFVLFPRIPGPLWAVQDQNQQAQTGLTEEMAPGDISRLSKSPAVAMRVTFLENQPSVSDMYWRGPVLWEFDGRRWSKGVAADIAEQREPAVVPRGQMSHYELILQPHQQRWMLALDLPVQYPSTAQLTADLRLLNSEKLRDIQRFKVRSALDYWAELQLNPVSRIMGLQLPAGTNPKAVALAQQWRAQAKRQVAGKGKVEASIVAMAMRHFQDQAFRYTLRPPALLDNPVDDFLFRTQAGFCEHFTSAFVVLMRAAGIPARVVTGYQGGVQGFGDYWLVRQADAHAWAEVWLPKRGWIRVDPTSAVAPERIQQGIGAALPDEAQLPLLARSDSSWLGGIRWLGDGVNAQWQRWVMGYDIDAQAELLEELGLSGNVYRYLGLLLVLSLSVFMLLLFVWIFWRRRDRHLAKEQRLYLKLQRRLKRRGWARRPAETLTDYRQRLAESDLENKQQLDEFLRLYGCWRYQPINLAQ